MQIIKLQITSQTNIGKNINLCKKFVTTNYCSIICVEGINKNGSFNLRDASINKFFINALNLKRIYNNSSTKTSLKILN